MSAEAYQGDVEAEPAGMPVQAADQPPDRDDDAGPVNPASAPLDAAGASPIEGTDDASAPAPADNVLKLPGGGTIKLPTQTDPTKDPQYIKLQEEEHELRQRAIDAAKAQVGNIEQARRERVRPPQLQSVPQAPQQDFQGAAHGFMLAAVALGALAGARGRSGATGALNAFSAALQGYHKGETEVWAQKSQEWKQQADQAISSNQEKLTQYNAIWKDQQMDLDQKMEEYKIVAGMYNDQISWNLADQRNYTMLGQTFQKDFNNTLTMAEKVANLQKTNQAMLDKAEDRKNEQNRIENMAQAIKDNRLAPSEVSFKDRNKVQERALALGVNVRDKDQQWDIIKADIHTLNSATMQRQITLDQSFGQEFARVMDAHAKLQGLTGWPWWNEQKFKVWEAEGNTPIGVAAAAYRTGINTLQELMASAYRQGYAPTDSSFALAKEAIKPGWTSAQLEESFKLAHDMLDIRVQNIKNLHTLGPEGAGVHEDGWGTTVQVN